MAAIEEPKSIYQGIERIMKGILNMTLTKKDLEKVEGTCSKYVRRLLTPQHIGNDLAWAKIYLMDRVEEEMEAMVRLSLSTAQ
jgi:hypothetical protein